MRLDSGSYSQGRAVGGSHLDARAARTLGVGNNHPGGLVVSAPESSLAYGIRAVGGDWWRPGGPQATAVLYIRRRTEAAPPGDFKGCNATPRRCRAEVGSGVPTCHGESRPSLYNRRRTASEGGERGAARAVTYGLRERRRLRSSARAGMVSPAGAGGAQGNGTRRAFERRGGGMPEWVASPGGLAAYRAVARPATRKLTGDR